MKRYKVFYKGELIAEGSLRFLVYLAQRRRLSLSFDGSNYIAVDDHV